jgi:hypothetical protein
LTNRDLHTELALKETKMTPHLEALLSRCLYLDLCIHTRDELFWHVEDIVTRSDVFDREGITEKVGRDILEFVSENRYTLRDLSIRSIVKCCSLAKASPVKWRRGAVLLLCRTNPT